MLNNISEEEQSFIHLNAKSFNRVIVDCHNDSTYINQNITLALDLKSWVIAKIADSIKKNPVISRK